jgi:hypothetical protein
MEFFSERFGFSKTPKALQLKTMNESLRIALYTYLYERFSQEWDPPDLPFVDPEVLAVLREKEGRGCTIAKRVWSEFWCRPLDEFSGKEAFLKTLKSNIVESSSWYEVYDLLEFLLRIDFDFWGPARINSILEKEMSGYRVLGSCVVPITDKEELDTLENSARLPDHFAGARTHIASALEKLSQKPKPDLRNAVKEAISAVESAARAVTGREKATLGDLLKTLKEEQGLHPALTKAWSSLYGYTSDEEGVRHAMLSEPNIDFALAKYMVVICAAFVNFLCIRFSEREHNK